MTLPAHPNAITLGNIQTEFGGSNPISLGEYYAGGSYVQSGATGQHGSIPSSGIISLDVFHGASGNGPASPLSTGYAYTYRFGGSAGCRVWVQANGHVYSAHYGVGSHTPSFTGDWYLANTAGIGSSYWARCTPISGPSPNSNNAALNTWVNITSDLYWGILQTGGGSSGVCTVKIEISSSSSGTPIVVTQNSPYYQLEAEYGV